jgi:hypothetical protein
VEASQHYWQGLPLVEGGPHIGSEAAVRSQAALIIRLIWTDRGRMEKRKIR